MVGRDGYTVGDLVDDVELLDGDLIDFVEHINAWDVDPVVTRDCKCMLSMKTAAQSVTVCVEKSEVNSHQKKNLIFYYI